MRMLRRHRLIEQFLVHTLNLQWDQVHEEAEHMEHAVSDFLIDKIDEFLGHPDYDPHGDPIPDSDGELRGTDRSTCALSECDVAMPFRVVRVLNQDPAFLQYLADSGCELGSLGVIMENNHQTGILKMKVKENVISLGSHAGRFIMVEIMSS